MSNLSSKYYEALARVAAHHDQNKTYSGKFLRPHAPAIKKLIDLHGVTSILDYGCGKGRQYDWVSHGDDASIPKGQTIEQFWGLKVHKFDPCWPPFAIEPVGQTFDLVLLTHVLGSVPLCDVQRFVGQVCSYATKAVYFAEKLGPVRKQVLAEDSWTMVVTDISLRALLASCVPIHLACYLATREKVAGEVVNRLSKL